MTGKSDGSFVGILMDNVEIEVQKVSEIYADRTCYNGKLELVIRWKNERT